MAKLSEDQVQEWAQELQGILANEDHSFRSRQNIRIRTKEDLEDLVAVLKQMAGMYEDEISDGQYNEVKILAQ